MLRLMHLADLHLGWEPSGLPREAAGIRKKERDSLVRRAADRALRPDWGVHLVIIAGDLFDVHDPEEALVDEVIGELARLTRAGIRVVTVPGNHDEISYHNSVYRRWEDEWPGHLVTAPMPEMTWRDEVAGVPLHLYSLAYTGGLTDVRSLSPFPRESGAGLHVACFHGSLDADTGERSLPLSSADLAAAQYDYVALGHLHGHQVKWVGDSPAVYPGIIEPKRPGEESAGCITLVELDEGGAKVQPNPISVRPHYRATVDLSTAELPEDAVALCRGKADPEAAVRLELAGTVGFPLDTAELTDNLRDDFFALSVTDATHLVTDEMARWYEDDPTVRGEFVRRMRDRLERTEDATERRVLQLALSRGLAAFGERDG